MGELSKSLKFMQSQLDEELGNVKKDITKLENSIKSIGRDLLEPVEVSVKSVELEDRLNLNRWPSRSPYETWETWEEKVQEILSNKLGFATKVDIYRPIDVIVLNFVISLVNIKNVSEILFVDLISSKININLKQ